MTSATQYNILQHNNSVYMKRKLWIEEMEELKGNEHIFRRYNLRIKNITCTFTLEGIAIDKHNLLINHIMNTEYYMLPNVLKSIINNILNVMITDSIFRYNIMILEPGDYYLCNLFEIVLESEEYN